MNGALLIDKPAGLTSHDVVGQIRHTLGVRRVGHTGTLDPFATGLLVILVGRATRLAQFLSGLEKEYEALVRLGYATDTGDSTGKRLPRKGNESNGPWDQRQIESALDSLRGEIDQVPPMYSAKKQGGKKLYELARKGLEVEREPVRVSIHKFDYLASGGEILRDNLDGTFDLRVRVACSSGTYIRTLAEDLGKQLGTGAHVVELRRTRVGDLLVDQAQSVGQVKQALADESLGTIFHKPDRVLERLPFMDLNDNEINRVLNGRDITIDKEVWRDQARVRMRDSDQNLLAIGVYDRIRKSLHPEVVIISEES